MKTSKKEKQFEVTFKGNKFPDEYGFGMNPPSSILLKKQRFFDKGIRKEIKERWGRNSDHRRGEMAKMKCWEKVNQKSLREHGISQWKKKSSSTVVIVSEFYPDAHIGISDGWQVHIFSTSEAEKGYPNSKVGIPKEEAFRLAERYMKNHDKC